MQAWVAYRIPYRCVSEGPILEFKIPYKCYRFCLLVPLVVESDLVKDRDEQAGADNKLIRASKRTTLATRTLLAFSSTVD
jgi:hypothetical protein